ncbi:MAG: T9SS type A sorting domain-containing protein [Bacteroidales bacterium]
MIKRKFFVAVIIILAISFSAWAQMELRLVNPSYSAFSMSDGMFVGSTGVMCGEKGALSITHDEGQTWTSVNLSPYQDLKQVFVEDIQHIWIMGDSLLYYSSDGGLNFQIVFGAPADKKLMRFRKRGTTSWILATEKTTGSTFYLLRSTTNWQSAPEILTLTLSEVKDFDFSDSQLGLVLTGSAFYQTQNGGNTFSKVQDVNEGERPSEITWSGGLIWYASGYTYTYAPSLVHAVPIVWKSGDAGNSWVRLTLPVNKLFGCYPNDLVVKDENTILLGLGESGEEGSRWPVLLSQDGGLTWDLAQTQPDITQTQFFTKRCWVMISENKYWSMENESLGALAYSNNGSQFYFADELVTNKIKDLTRNKMFDNGSHLFLINSRSSDFLQSSQWGIAWDTVAGTSLFPTGKLERIAFGDFNKGIATGSYISLSTTNGGVSWSRYNYSSTYYLTFKDLEFPSPNVAYRRMTYIDPNTGALMQKVEKTTNVGQNWTSVTIPDLNVSRMVFVSELKGFLFGLDESSGQWGYYKTNDGAQTWEWNILPSNISFVHADMPADSVAMVAGDNRMFRLNIRNIGYDITEIALPVGALKAYDFTDVNHGVIVMEDSLFGHAFYTDDGGASWHEYTMLLPRGLNRVTLCNNLLNGYIYGLRNVLIQIDDGMPLIRPDSEVSKLEIRPNPVRDFVEFAGKGKAMLEISSLTGQLLYKSTVVLPLKLSVQGWSDGLYIYQISKGSQKAVGKFLKISKR